MTRDIQDIINTCPYCTNPTKFKKLKKRNKIIIENGPHYRYVADLWNLPKDIADSSEYKYVLIKWLLNSLPLSTCNIFGARKF